MAKLEKTQLGVFIKYPRPGKVKTRLAEAVGFQKAAELSMKMASIIIDNALDPLPRKHFNILFCYDPFESVEMYRGILPTKDCLFAPQIGLDLGQRLSHFFCKSLDSYASAIAIGTDCIDLNRTHIEVTREYLTADPGTDIVIGPAIDGGYYLIGMRHFYQEVFNNITWSSAEVLNQTLDRAKLQVVKLLEPLTDIDTVEDLLRSSSFRN